MNIEERLQSKNEVRLASSILRAEATNIVPIIPNHYFSTSSSEIRDMFIDGYFMGAIFTITSGS